ncbi:Thiamine import ATP-binding protein ThiQ [Vibrio stylophorae]|uniref:Thiamine import ATP-binding protein ThiQ n=1 Tax=Vibrio stylophorae TaxID=659351 RepID=A0ABM8ZQE5_9VIBR|nr:thiamine ABC transporter ATP-binding protein [Vibrio stylophorae]CAH0532526.1 Thiamine import ATP-binding protein ThiQ [Vibrio stylophorae]
MSNLAQTSAQSNQLTLRQLCFDYGSVETQFSTHCEIEAGTITAILGASGAGKSTLLHLLAGFLQPKQGEMQWQGQVLNPLAVSDRPLSILFQQHNLFDHLTVAHNIGLGIRPALRFNAQEKRAIEQAAAQVGLSQQLNQLPPQLSGGQQQRVALARCLIRQKPLLLLDEPFSALDPALRQQMLALVAEKAKAKNITVLMVTHDLNDAKAIASHALFVDRGQAMCWQPMSALLARRDSAWLDYLGATPDM